MRSNKTLSHVEFQISQHIKRAMVSLHDRNYNDAESNLSDALQKIYTVNRG